MKKIIDLIPKSEVLKSIDFPIWRAENLIGQPFWGVDTFCGIDIKNINAETNLTDLEWDGNEIYFCDAENIVELVKQGLVVVYSWKMQMEQEYPLTSFDIILSLDVGDDDISPSINMRFWAVRDDYHYLIPCINELDKFKIEPILMEQVNYKFIDTISDRLNHTYKN